MKKKIGIAIAILVALLIGWVIFRFFSVINEAQAVRDDKVKICHATGSESNPYIVNYPDKNGDVNGHDGHENDIIPPFIWYECPSEWWKYDSFTWKECKMKIFGFWKYADEEEHNYPGKNWDEEGRAIWNNDCQIPEPVCEIESWSCEECQTPLDSENACFSEFGAYCQEHHGCSFICQEPIGDTGLFLTFQSAFIVVQPDDNCEWICEDTCEPEPTPSPEPEPKDEVCHTCPAPAPACGDATPGDVANVYVYGGAPNDNCVEVRWIPPTGADKAHIRYSEIEGEWQYALLNTDNDGVEEICGLQNGVHYWFQVAGVNGCAVGNWSNSFDPLP